MTSDAKAYNNIEYKIPSFDWPIISLPVVPLLRIRLSIYRSPPHGRTFLNRYGRPSSTGSSLAVRALDERKRDNPRTSYFDIQVKSHLSSAR